MPVFRMNMPTAGLKEQAKLCVMRHMVQLAESDGVPATQRAMHLRKLEEAKRTLAGGTASPLIVEEARLRTEILGVATTPLQLAQTISDMAARSDALELQRMRINMTIDKLEDEDVDSIMAVLDAAGVPFTHD